MGSAWGEGVDPGYPATISTNWGNWPSSFASGIDAAVNWGTGKVYFFKGSNYTRYDIAGDQTDSGYPLSIALGWPTFPLSFMSGVDAALNYGNGKAYFFKGSQYIRYDIAADQMDSGYPLPIAGNWRNFPSTFTTGVDAALNYGNGKVYFFKGSQYLRYDIASNTVDPGYPLPIAGNWSGWPSTWTGINDAVDTGNGKVYFFNGSNYLRYDKGYLTASTSSNIKHVVLIVQENHTFDAYFGRYCTSSISAAPPTCNSGPACCQEAPYLDSGNSPYTLDDTFNAVLDHDHSNACEVAEIDNGLMDHFTQGASCSSTTNFALAPAGSTELTTYRQYASTYALADRYFQPYAGPSFPNGLYFAVARLFQTDNTEPSSGSLSTAPTVGSLLAAQGVTWTTYSQGYSSGVNDPGDNPFAFFVRPAFLDANWSYQRDYAQFAHDVGAHTLPAFSYVKADNFYSEHPGYGTNISNGVGFVSGVVSTILSSPYANETLIVLTFDEGGGFLDHVSPPAAPSVTVDGLTAPSPVPYGTRVPMLAIGNFARQNYVSHSTLEHSSVVKFLEWNWLGGTTGQLHARDSVVNNIGDLLDPAKTGVPVPSTVTP